MSNIVYVITKGAYSAYTICAVTMNEERAKRLCELFSGRYEEARIEEYTLEEERQFRIYCVEFDANTHEYISTTIDEYGYYEDGRYCRRVYTSGRIEDAFYVKAADEEHARKIAQDRYAEKRAREAGIV